MGFLSELAAGVVAPSGPALAVGLLGGLAGAAAWIGSIDTAWIAENPGLLATADGDVGAFGTARVVALAQAPPGRPTILVLGGSAIREAVSSHAALDGLLRAQGVEADLHLITGLNQHLWQSEAFLDLAPPATGVLVLGLDATQLLPAAEVLRWDADTPRYGLDLPVLDRRLAEAGFSPGPLALRRWTSDRVGFLIPRAWYPLRRVFSGPIAEEPHQYNRAAEKRPSWAYAQLGEYFRAPSPVEVESQLAAAEAVIALARAKGYRPVLLRTPRDRSYFSPEAVAGMEAGDATLDTWAAGLGVSWLDPGKEAEIRPDELYDWCHLFRTDGEARWTAAFARQLADVWEAR